MISSWFGPGPALNNPAQLKLISEAGFNVVGPRTWNPQHHPFYPPADYLKFLDHCQKVGMKAIVVDRRLIADPGKAIDEKAVEAAISTYKNHPAVSHYLIYDEPSKTQFKQLECVSALVKKFDPNHPAFVNLFPNYANEQQLGAPSYPEYVESFLETLSLPMLSVDVYPVLKKGMLPTYFETLEVIRDRAAKAGVDAWLSIQSWDSAHHRLPSEAEIRWQANQGLAYGFRAIFYFTLYAPGPNREGILTWGGQKGSLYDSVQSINRELLRVGRILVLRSNLGTYHTGNQLPRGTKPLPKGFPLQIQSKSSNLTIGHFAGKESGSELFFIVNGSASYRQRVEWVYRDQRRALTFLPGQGVLTDGTQLY